MKKMYGAWLLGAYIISAPLTQAATLTVSNQQLTLREAHTPADIEQGLMYVTDLNSDAGMIFVMPQPAITTFWMKNTPLSLDILFIDEAKKIVHIHPNATPFSLTTIQCLKPVKWVIELKAGLSKQLNIKVNDSVSLNFDTPS